MSRREKLIKAMNRLLEDGTAEGDYLLATMFCGLILKDVDLGTRPSLQGVLSVFEDLLRDRDQMITVGDYQGIVALKADVRAALTSTCQRLLEKVADAATRN
jgi:hypothetical protein